MNWRSEIKFSNLAFIIALLIFSFLCVFTYIQFQQNARDEAMVRHTYEVIILKKAFLSNLKDAETGQRGYLLTGNENYLEPFYMSVEKNNVLLNALRDSTRNNMQQQVRINQVENYVTLKLLELKKTIYLRRNQSLEAALAIVRTNRGKLLMDNIRTITNNIESAEKNLLLKREKTARRSLRFTAWLLATGCMVTMLILLAVYYVLRRQIRRRVNTELALRENKEWLSSVLQSIGDAVIATDRDQLITSMNPVAESLTGWPLEKAKGKPIDLVFNIINEDTRARVVNPVAEAMSQKKILGLAKNTILIRADKTEIYVDDSASPITDLLGNITGAVLVFRDISEHKKAETELLNYSYMIDQASDAIISSDLDFKVTSWNKAAEKLYGIRKDEAIGQSSLELIRNESNYTPQREAALKLLMEKGELKNESPQITRYGDTIYVRSSVSSVKNAAGKIIALVSVMIDVTERRKEEQKIIMLNKDLEEKNRSILDSILYAKRIQDAILPEQADLFRLFPLSFILYKPKDIVSGDFYWFREYGNKTIVAVADCTGHGVAGAFMSILGNNLLEKIITDEKIYEPGEILNRLNTGVKKALKQYGGYNQTNSGMEIALCSIDRESRMVEFAGAGRPLLIAREDNVRLIKGNRFGIGGYTADEKKFTTIKTKLGDNESLYLFTDGYADQFGEKRNKRMFTKYMVNMIYALQTCDIKKREQILTKWFEEWKANLEQTDDVLLVGIDMTAPKRFQHAVQ